MRAAGKEDDGQGEFERHRTVLLGLAYRMLGSMWDAEDVVQDAWPRWAAADRAAIRDARAFLITVVSRLAIDRLRLVQRRRETYVGPWLPEPVDTERWDLGPLNTATRRDAVSTAALRLMEQLSPPERAVYVLREAFALPYREIAMALNVTEPNARQLHRRAGARIAAGRPRFTPDRAAHRKFVERFAAAASTGEIAALTSMLADDVVLWTDGGGKVRAARNPIIGTAKVVRFARGLLAKHARPEVRVVELNGTAGLVMWTAGRRYVCSFELGGPDAASPWLVTGIQAMSNPDKLTHAPAPALDTQG